MTNISFDAETARVLERYGFDRETFERLRERLRQVGRGPEQNVIAGKVSAPGPDDVGELPARGTPARAQLEQLGMQAIAAGQVGVIYLAGGMATRFGGVVKAAAEVVDGRSFLDVKLADVAGVAARANANIP